MLRKGFTLIELLIVITIIAVLAGSAVPYVQDYVEDARIARAKGDLDEIRNALIRFELDRGVQYLATTTADLVGPYLDKAPIDPWGVPYCISATSSVVFSVGPNRDSNHPEFGGAGGLGDDIGREYRPPLALSKAYWVDNDKNGAVSVNDTIKLRFTRPANATEIAALVTTSYAIKHGTTKAVIGVFTMTTVAENIDTSTNATKDATVTLTAVTVPFVPARDTINLTGLGPLLHDVAQPPYGPATCSQNLVAIQSL